MLLDSPLNQAGFLEVFIRLDRVIRLHKEVRIPRTYKRFEQLLSNFLGGCDMPLVQTKDGPARLFQFVKTVPEILPKFRIVNLTNRVRSADHFTGPIETQKRAMILIDLEPIDVNFLGDSRDTEYEMKVKVKNPEADTYSISHYPLMPSLACVKITSAFERALEVF